MLTKLVTRIILASIIGLALLFLFLRFQVNLATKAYQNELTTLSEIDTLLLEVRTLLTSLDDPSIHPLEKQVNINVAINKIRDYSLPRSDNTIFNPFNLTTVDQTNARRLALQSARQEIPLLLNDTHTLTVELNGIYEALTNFFEYNPYRDLNNLSYTENTDDFLDRLNRAEKGITKTISKINKQKISDTIQRDIIKAITPSKQKLDQLISATKDKNEEASNLFRTEFLETIFPAQIQLDSLLTTTGNRKELIEKSRTLSTQIQQAITSEQ